MRSSTIMLAPVEIIVRKYNPCSAAPLLPVRQIGYNARSEAQGPPMIDDIPGLRRVLKQNKVIAVVGLSADWFRPSYFAAKYMIEHGYTVIPVNPRCEEILGQKCYKSLGDIPVKVDIVDVFRKSEDVAPIAEEAIAIGARGRSARPGGGD